jgi:hypothetical protein
MISTDKHSVASAAGEVKEAEIRGLLGDIFFLGEDPESISPSQSSDRGRHHRLHGSDWSSSAFSKSITGSGSRMTS